MGTCAVDFVEIGRRVFVMFARNTLGAFRDESVFSALTFDLHE